MTKTMAPKPVDIPSFCTTQLHLLDSELQSELSETSTLITGTSPTSLQRAGLAITNLVLISQRTGLGGKTVVELGLDSAISGKGGKEEGELPEHGIRTGDIVMVSELPGGSAKKREVKELEEKGCRGVVTRVGGRTVWVALEGEEDAVEGRRLWVVKLANDVTYKRMNQTMKRLQKMQEVEYSSFVRVMFGLSSSSPVPANLDEDTAGMEWVDPSLNDSQKHAIKFALASREIALIHGPPGTGKTHTLIELILQMLKRKLRVLVCGPSNISVDNIVERLAPHKVPIVRLGHPARLLPSVVSHSLDVLTQTSDAAAIVQDVRKEMDSKQASIKKTKSGRERKAIYGDLKELRKEFRERERKCVNTLVGGSKVVLATLHGAGGFQLRDEKFDVVIIDEASQALEAQCWVPLLSASKVVLAGDHLQLPPTIKSLNSTTKPKVKEAEGVIKGMTLETTLFDSEEEDIDKKGGKGMLGESKSNEMEAALVRRHVQNLVNAGLKPDDIAIVTPYNAQLALMSRSMKEAFPGIELGSVDGFQGREKEAIIVSLVRSNSEHEVGFLGEKRRLNVAMTRPRRSLTIIGDLETVSRGSKFLKRWMDFLEENADLRYPSVAELNS
ncbi:hypothetical protein CJF31_00004067 [Rutstroemia sp. NJR-2017a BVV2]|nr:hypothetical protein CJF31_00004067 [Rutstroemia sp. NJR-2017a BVV2]